MKAGAAGDCCGTQGRGRIFLLRVELLSLASQFVLLFQEVSARRVVVLFTDTPTLGCACRSTSRLQLARDYLHTLNIVERAPWRNERRNARNVACTRMPMVHLRVARRYQLLSLASCRSSRRTISCASSSVGKYLSISWPETKSSTACTNAGDSPRCLS